MEERKKQRKEVSEIKIEGAIKEGSGNRAMFNFMGRLWGSNTCCQRVSARESGRSRQKLIIEIRWSLATQSGEAGRIEA